MSEQSMTSPATSGSDEPVRYADASQRALEAYDSLPADSQYSTDPEERVRMALEASDTVFDESEVETIVKAMTPLVVGHGVVNNNTFLPKMDPTPYYELGVDITVNFPDGTRVNYSEASEREAADDYDFDQAADLLADAVSVVRHRLRQTD